MLLATTEKRLAYSRFTHASSLILTVFTKPITVGPRTLATPQNHARYASYTLLTGARSDSAQKAQPMSKPLESGTVGQTDIAAPQPFHIGRKSQNIYLNPQPYPTMSTLSKDLFDLGVASMRSFLPTEPPAMPAVIDDEFFQSYTEEDLNEIYRRHNWLQWEATVEEELHTEGHQPRAYVNPHGE